MVRKAVPAISVVIPAWNAHAALRRALDATRLPGVERIVVDGGSTDGTREAARFLRADRILCGRRPDLARQMELGFRAAAADVIVFLSPDTRLDRGWEIALLDALRDPRVQGGAFRCRFESERRWLRLLEWGARVRTRVFAAAHTGQALFARRSFLDRIGGVPDAPIFADFDLCWTIREHGRLALLSHPAWSSDTRCDTAGLVRDGLALAGYLLDVDRRRLARWRARSDARWRAC